MAAGYDAYAKLDPHWKQIGRPRHRAQSTP